MRVQSRLLAGEAEVLTPDNPEPFIRMAGEKFLGREGDTMLVRGAGGCIHHAHPGWVALRLDAAPGQVTFLGEGLFGDRDDQPWGPEQP